MNRSIKLNSIVILLNTILFIFLLVTLLFTPTSNNYIIETEGNIRSVIIVLLSLTLVFLNGKLNKNRIVYFVGIQITLYFFTLMNLIRDPSIFTWNFGSYLLITALTLSFMFDFNKGIINPITLRVLLFILNIVIIAWAFGIIFDNNLIKDFTLANYSQYTGWSVMVMLEQNKPIYSFGTHSFSALFTFIMLLINLVNIDKKDGLKLLINIVVILSYLFILVMTQSTTALVYFLISLLIIGVILRRVGKKYINFYFLLMIASFFLFILILNPYYNIINFQNFDGFTDRYLSGIFNNTFSFLMNYFAIGILRPINENVLIIDSGIINFFMKGNFVFPILFYVAFYNFLNINIKYYGSIFFISFLLFEIGVTFFAVDARALAFVIMVTIFTKSRLENNW